MIIGLFFAGCRKEQMVEPEIISITDEDAIQADRTTREQLTVTLHEGFELKLWASEKLVQDPVALHADNSGRIFITTTNRRRNAELDIRRYRPWFIESLILETVDDRIRFIEREFPADKPGEVSGQTLGDLTGMPEEVFILEDTSGNGFANRSTLFIRDFDEPVTDVAGALLTFGDDVYVGVSPDLWRVRDTTGDGYGNQKESISYGFGVNLGFGGHGMSGLVTGPDGRIYWSIGDVGMSVTDKDGKKWHYPRQGVVVRAEPDGSNFEVFAAGLRNTHEFDFDQYGNLISVDNDGDHPGEFERLVYLVDGSDSGWRLNWQFGKYDDPKNNSYKVLMDEEYYKPRFDGQAAHILPPLSRYRTGPAGMVYNPGTALSEEWKGYFFVAEFAGAASRSGINAFRLRPVGASFELESDREVMRGILATGLDIGPDGALYFADWMEGWELKQEGRIWRMDTPGGAESALRQDTQNRLGEDFSGHSPGRLAELLQHADMRVRKKAQFELASRDDRETLLDVARHSNHQLARIHGLWGMAQIARRSPFAAEPITNFLNDPDDEIRAQSAKMLGDVRYTPAADAIIPLLNDENLRVRFFAMEALGRMAWKPAFDAIVDLLSENNDEDVYLRHGGAIALQRLDDEAAVAELCEDGRCSDFSCSILRTNASCEQECNTYPNSVFIPNPSGRGVCHYRAATGDDRTIGLSTITPPARRQEVCEEFDAARCESESGFFRRRTSNAYCYRGEITSHPIWGDQCIIRAEDDFIPGQQRNIDCNIIPNPFGEATFDCERARELCTSSGGTITSETSWRITCQN